MRYLLLLLLIPLSVQAGSIGAGAFAKGVAEARDGYDSRYEALKEELDENRRLMQRIDAAMERQQMERRHREIEQLFVPNRYPGIN